MIFQFDSNQDFITAFWACTLGGFVPVPISTAPIYEPSNSIVKKLHNAWQLLGQPIVLTNDNLVHQLRSLSGKLNQENFQVETINDLRSINREQNWHNSQPDDLAVLLFTSGSTGMPKGVMLSHRNILSSVAGTSEMSNFTSQDVSLNWLPLDHPGPLVRCVIRTVFLGCQQIHTPTAAILADPLKWFDWIELYRVTSTWAPNFAFALVNDRADEIEKRRWDLSSVRSFLNTAEPIAPQTARRFLELMTPHGLATNAMHSSWGMAETCSSVTLSDRYLLDSSTLEDASFVELGSPIPGISLRIVNEQNEVVEEQTIGYLQVKGVTVTSGYYYNPELSREMFSSDGWFNTGDLGFLHEGRLTITGRTKDVLIVNGNNYYTHEIEAVVEEVKGVKVSYTAACAIRQPNSNTEQLSVFFHTSISDDARLVELLKEIQKNVVRKIGISPAYLIPVEKEAIPKTSIGKIQRSQLKQHFEAGRFDAIVKRVDVLLGNDNTLPDWFYRKIWRRKEITALEAKPRTGQCLVFLDCLGLGEFLLEEQVLHNQHKVGVEAGLDFAKLADNRYCIDPKNPDHYKRLLEVITEELPIDSCLHLWTYDQYIGEIESCEALEQAQNYGTYSLLLLVQALDKVQETQTPVRLGVISSHIQFTSPDDEIAYEKGSILGLIKTLPRENPWLDCFHIDLPVGSAKVNATCILREMRVLQREREVVYRNGQRLVPRLHKANLTRQQKQELPFKLGGMYLISGGLGGIGVEIARYLLQQYQARLLLVGRTSLPAKNTWSAHLEKGGAVSERIKAYLSLETLGGKIVYEAVDIGDLTQLQQVSNKVKNHWQCELDGVIHLAGIVPERLLFEETRESLAATLRPKVFGTWALHQLVKNQPGCVFISFSSIISFFGGATVGAYAAANNFLDCFGLYQRYKQGIRSYCFSSSTWDDVGVSRGYQGREATRAQGHYAMSIDQGLSSLLGALHHDQGHILVGLEGSSHHILRYTETQAYSNQKLCAYFTAQKALSVADLQTLEVRDRFGTRARCEFRQIKEMPLTESGEIDTEQLTATGRRAAAQLVIPRDEIERGLASIWQEVLGVPQLGIHDNFFELGGHSMLAIQLFAAIEQEFDRKLPLATLFEVPTIEQLASILRPSEHSATWDSLVLIKPGDASPPLFLVHDAEGETILYLNLARHLESERPVYGLRPYSQEGYPILHTRIKDMVSHYIEKIRSIQSEGPYLLGGLCMGGVLAFEIARQLQAQGQKIALVALFDAADVQAPKRIGQITGQRLSRFSSLLRQEQQLRGQERLNYILNKALEKVKNLITYEFKTKVENRRDKFKVMIYRYYLDKGLTLPKFLQNISVRTVYKFAAQEYVPQVYQGKVILFRASFGVDTDEPLVNIISDPLFGWGKRATDGVKVYDTPGGHSSMLQEPFVQVLAEKLKADISAADAEESNQSQPRISTNLKI